jgi:pyrroloquinoline quinone biosynthesis protein B
MGHLPISGANGSLEMLRRLSAKRKVYLHINNTNPVLLEDSTERETVQAAGCEIGYDGMEIII